MEKRPTYSVIIREDKKSILCDNECYHLDNVDEDNACCVLFNKNIQGGWDNYKPCKECLEYFNSIKEIE